MRKTPPIATRRQALKAGVAPWLPGWITGGTTGSRVGRVAGRFGGRATGSGAGGLVLGLASQTGCATGPTPDVAVTSPPTDAADYRIPADFEPTRAIWLGWDPGHLAFTVSLIKALQGEVHLRILATDEAAVHAAGVALRAQGLTPEGFDFQVDKRALYFVRDAAVFAAAPGSRLGVVDLRWSAYGLPGWCARRHGDDGAAVQACTGDADATRQGLDVAIAHMAGAAVLPSALALEGGGLESNGKGLVIANETLVRQRNPSLSNAELEALYKALPGVRRVIWLPEGLAEDPQLRSTIVKPYVGWGTGGHTDEFVRFADARTVLLAWPDEIDATSHPVARLNRQRMQRNFEVLQRSSTPDGQALRVLKVPLPRTIERRIFLSAAAEPGWSKEWTADFFPPQERHREGDAVMQVAAASYLNFVVANGVVVLPSYVQHGTPRATQERVRKIFEEAFPGRRLVFVDAIGANWVGGGPHCATLNEPLVR